MEVEKDKIYSVSEFVAFLNADLKWMKARIVGEVSEAKAGPTGHMYFTLKDEHSVIACTCWKGVLDKLNVKLSDGMSIVVTGKITIYGGQSKYQLNVANIKLVGEGVLMQMFFKLKAKLEQEGIFLPSHKKKLPKWPKIIGVITSLHGAVFSDIVHRIKDRCPTRVILYPTSVQGSNAVSEVINAVEWFNDELVSKNKSKAIVDVIIIARGGGSIEDLWCFNDERIVRAIFASKIPVVSAIGHETDFTLSDFVADVRAPTPTAAAEFVVPVLLDEKAKLVSIKNRLSHIVAQYFANREKILSTFVLLTNPFQKCLATY